MNITEQTAGKKQTFPAYQFQKYPMTMYKPGETNRTVTNEVEEETALADGYTETPPAIPQSIAVAPMSTQPALQAAYEALQKELESKTVEFNVKHGMLQAKHEALDRSYKALSESHLALQGDHAELKQDHETLMENHELLAAEMARKVGPPEASRVTESDPEAENVSAEGAEDPFAQMK